MMRIVQTCLAPLLGWAAILLYSSAAHAQQSNASAPSLAEIRSAAPEIISMHIGADELYRQLDYVLGLTNPEERQQLKTVKDYIDIFLIGIDRAKPVRVDVLMGEPLLRYIGSFPLESLADFRLENLNSLAIDSRRKFSTLYELSMGQAAKREVIGYMRIKEDYAIISEVEEEVPLSLPNPRKAIAHLEAKYQAALEGRNSKPGEAEQNVRRASFDVNTRQEMLALIKQLEDESEDAFELRKLLTEHMLDEAGRFYVEAAHLLLGGNIDYQKGTGVAFDFSVTPIPGTELAASFDLLARRPSDFANVPRSESPVLSARVNHPLDKMRQENLTELSDFLRRLAKKDAAEDENATEEEKANRAKGFDLFFDLLNKNIAAGEFDGFVEVHPSGEGRHTGVGAIRAADASTFVDILKLMPKASQNQKVETEIETVNGVQIHRFVHGKTNDALFNDFLGGDSLYFGVSENAIWYAGGPNALEELKAAIAAAAQENAGKPGDPVLDVIVKLGPWMELRNKRQQGRPASDSVLKFRKMALDAFAVGDDQLTVSLQKKGQDVVGFAQGRPGLLRLVGKLIADFSRENLAEQ